MHHIWNKTCFCYSRESWQCQCIITCYSFTTNHQKISAVIPFGLPMAVRLVDTGVKIVAVGAVGTVAVGVVHIAVGAVLGCCTWKHSGEMAELLLNLNNIQQLS